MMKENFKFKTMRVNKDSIRVLLLNLCILVLAFSISSCAVPLSRSQSALEKNSGKFGVYDYMVKLLSHASLATSVHNTQPWKIKIISDSEIVIQADQ